jgi:Predicted membrane protein (DUF2142)
MDAYRGLRGASSDSSAADQTQNDVGHGSMNTRLCPERRSFGWACVLVAPYLLLGIVWVVTNPPGAAPDENDHLVKALGMSNLDIGSRYESPRQDESPTLSRLSSQSRVVKIPARLNPAGFTCFAFNSKQAADCLPRPSAEASGQVALRTTIGSYPPFLYVPLGLAAQATHSTAQAFRAARLVALAVSCCLLLIGIAHVLRWLGRTALLGLFIGMTPMTVFCISIVSTSGIEITAAFAVAAVVALRRPESLVSTSTQMSYVAAATVLVLSRQLGVVTFSVLTVLIFTAAGWTSIWSLMRQHRPSFLATIGVLSVAVAALVAWELRYDRPTQIGSAWSLPALQSLREQAFGIIQSGIGNFGWLDVELPQWCISLWVILAVTLCGAALLLGRLRDRVVLMVLIAAVIAVAYFLYAMVFFPAGFSVQGRYLIALSIGVPLMSGVVVADCLLSHGLVRELRQAFAAVGLSMAFLQLVAIYWNGRRYATGTDGPLVYWDAARWSPPLGWLTWLAVGTVAAAILAAVALSCRPRAVIK